jgi:hypothetical protein
MRLLRTVGLVLTLWAVAALALEGLAAWFWFRTPSPAEAEIRQRAWARHEPLGRAAAGLGLACLALASLLGRGDRTRPAQPGGVDLPPTEAGESLRDSSILPALKSGPLQGEGKEGTPLPDPEPSPRNTSQEPT